MLSAKQRLTIDMPWVGMTPLRLGKVPTGLRTADLFVTISDDDRALLRVDLFGDSSSESFTFQDAIVWGERVFVGYGHRVYVIEPKKQAGSQIFLGPTCSCFNAFYSGQDYLLVASGESLIRLAPDGSVLWAASNLALDGVTVKSVENGLVRGQGEWNPPGGWKPFALRLDSGELVDR
jgi:hypothetical protein